MTQTTLATPTTVTTVATHTRTENAVLPVLAGLQNVLEKIAEFSGVLFREELRRTRSIGPSLDAVDWAVYDAHLAGW